MSKEITTTNQNNFIMGIENKETNWESRKKTNRYDGRERITKL